MRQPIVLSGLVLVGLLLLLAAVALSTNGISAVGTQTAQTLNVPNNSQDSLTPMPAQSPAPDPIATIRAQGRPQSKPLGVPAINPPVTMAKMRDYVARNPSGGGIVGKNITVESINFITVHELQELLKESYLDSFGPDKHLVYVILSGEFIADEINTKAAYRVFDAETGNELMGGLK